MNKKLMVPPVTAPITGTAFAATSSVSREAEASAEWPKLAQAADTLYKAPIFIDGHPRIPAFPQAQVQKNNAIPQLGLFGQQRARGDLHITGVSANGAGQTLALFELDGYKASDVAAYAGYFGLPTFRFRTSWWTATPAPPEAMTGMCKASAMVLVSSQSKPACVPSASMVAPPHPRR
jgi:hypothetical protein